MKLYRWSDEQLSVGQLRAALEGLPDDMGVIVEYDNQNGMDEALLAYVDKVDNRNHSGSWFTISSGP